MKRVDDPEESSRTTADEFDGDPSVRTMRRVFSALEAAQKEFIMELGLSPFDHRLRRWRERTLAVFEASWARSARGGLELSETEAGALYVHCFGKIMAREGMVVPPELLPQSEKIKKILREVLP